MKIFYLIFLLFSLNSALGNKQSHNYLPKTISEDTLRSDTRTYHFEKIKIVVPNFLDSVSGKNEELLLLQSSEKDIYIQFFLYDHDTFRNNLTNKDSIKEGAELLPAFHRSYVKEEIIMLKEKGIKVQTDPTFSKVMINGSKAMQSEIKVEINSIEYSYGYTSIKGPSDYLHIIFIIPIKTSVNDIKEVVYMLNSIVMK